MKPSHLILACTNYQLFNDPAHILEKLSSCIDLIFTSQPSIVVNSCAHSSLHANCQHQNVFAKFDLNIYDQPPYEVLFLLDRRFVNSVGKEPYQI